MQRKSPAISKPFTNTTSDRKSTRLNYSHTDIYTLSLHDALPISDGVLGSWLGMVCGVGQGVDAKKITSHLKAVHKHNLRSEEHTSELQSHRYIHSFPTRRSSDLRRRARLVVGDGLRRGSGGRCKENHQPSQSRSQTQP